jgi:hypothetical protein
MYLLLRESQLAFFTQKRIFAPAKTQKTNPAKMQELTEATAAVWSQSSLPGFFDKQTDLSAAV